MNANLFDNIMKKMQENNWNRTDLAKHSGLHLSDISRIFNHKQSLSLQNLDTITKSLGLDEGFFYSFYLEECFNESRYLDKRKSEQFLYNCADKGFEGLLLSFFDLILEERSKPIRNKSLSSIFMVAEKLFTEGKERESLPLYEVIIENMPDKFSEEVAISYFRRFYIVRFTEEGQYALGQVLEHIAYMPKKIQLQAYMWITATFYIRREWKKTLYYAQRLEKLAEEDEYYGRALLYQSFALRCLGGSLEEVLSLIDRYAQVNEYFAEIAIGNRLVTYIDFGQLDYVDEYFNWLKDRNDIFAGLPRVLEAFVKLSRLEDAKQLITKYQHIINEMAKSNVSSYKQQMYLRFRYAYALYLFECNRISEGLDEVLNVAFNSKKIGIIERFKQCLLIYWKHREHVTSKHEEIYLKLLDTDQMSKVP
ncbi:helix-turn-helix domain-containing protein [Gottfriedia luciferensis]|uniref:helix-turn-helix domain-containing protein n=1 Tax=Gottfriedia luciferensis TaxID=178774 RepID=UPI001302A782|nr:helix-turn-helix transcriptional regulator [Gottfriedia luciferensis]